MFKSRLKLHVWQCSMCYDMDSEAVAARDAGVGLIIDGDWDGAAVRCRRARRWTRSSMTTSLGRR
jgi:hypothetical protein